MTWDDVLAPLTMQPRENGSAAVGETATRLADLLARTGAQVTRVPYTMWPYGTRIAGVAALVTGIVFAWLVWRRRYGMALVVAVPVNLALFLEFAGNRRIFGRFGGLVVQDNVVARLAATAPRQRLILSAHFDTITEAVDHVASARLDLLHAVAPAVAFTLVGMATGRAAAGRETRSWRAVALVCALLLLADGVGFFAEAGAGLLLRERSHGAIDDGAACAVLVRAAERLAAHGPLAHTDVEVVLFSGEEEMVQGSAAYAAARFATPPDLPTRMVNFEFLGMGSNLAVMNRQAVGLKTLRSDSGIVALLDRVYRATRGSTIPGVENTGFASSDARSFLQVGVPAATVVSYDAPEPARHLHTAWDDRAHLASDAVLSETLDFILAVVAATEAEGTAAGRGA